MTTNFEDTGATPRNAEECERIARILRPLLASSTDEKLPPILKVLDSARSNIPQLAKLELMVRYDDLMGRAEGAANLDRHEIEIRESDVEGVLHDTPQMRFLILHEIEHVLLHTGQNKFFRITNGNIVHSFLGGEETSAEWQANRIARALLMPPEMVGRAANARELAEMAGAPIQEAIARFKELAPPKGQPAPQSVVNAISKLRLSSDLSSAERSKLEAQDQKLELWNELAPVPGESPRVARLCGKYQILWDEFGRATGCGWFIENGKICAHYERYD